MFSRKLAVRDDRLSGLPEGYYLHRQVSSEVIGDFTVKVSDGRPICMALLEPTDVAPTCTLAAAVMQFSFHLQPSTFSQGMESVPLEDLPFKLVEFLDLKKKKRCIS